MSDAGQAGTGTEKKPRKPRSDSKYMLLQQRTEKPPEGSEKPTEPVKLPVFDQIGSNFRTPAAAWTWAESEKLTGELMVVCIRRVRVGRKQETFAWGK